MEKSYVSMGTCPICQKENGTILMDKRIKDSLERFTPTLEPCDKCDKEYLTDGIMLVGKKSKEAKEVEGIAVIKKSAFKKLFNLPTPTGKMVFCDIEVLKKITKS